MFQACDFTYAGKPASMFGLFLADIGGKSHGDNSFGNKANIVETRLPGRVRPLHFGVRYHDEPLKFSLIFCSEDYMDRYQLQEVSEWLTGYQDYQLLTIDQPDLEHVRFRCLIQSLTPVSVGWFPVGFEAQVVCDCPYGYGYPFQETVTMSGSCKMTFYNRSTVNVRFMPKLHVALNSGCTEFKLKNVTAGEELHMTKLPAGGCIFDIDNENGILTAKNAGVDLYKGFNYRFFSLLRGANELEFTGNGQVSISGEFLYNVGA